MEKILSSTSGELQGVAEYAEQLARLTRLAWTGPDGICYFPYAPLAGPDFWREQVAADWDADMMRSFALLQDGQIVAHAALVRKATNRWELGRWVAKPEAPRGAVTELSRRALGSVNGDVVHVECTQAHTSSQAICERLDLRFAGIGILSAVGEVCWDIIYYDNCSGPEFTVAEARARHATGNPHGQVITVNAGARRRLEQINSILTSERGGVLPPTQFHILPHRLDTVREIIKFALE